MSEKIEIKRMGPGGHETKLMSPEEAVEYLDGILKEGTHWLFGDGKLLNTLSKIKEYLKKKVSGKKILITPPAQGG